MVVVLPNISWVTDVWKVPVRGVCPVKEFSSEMEIGYMLVTI